MEIHPLILQLLGSLAAILAVYGIARLMRLGGNPKLSDDAAVEQAAEEVENGFIASRVAISRNGKAALAKDPSGRIMVIKRHGNRFAGRILSSTASAREEVDALVVESGESQFGSVRMTLKEPAIWADAINRL